MWESFLQNDYLMMAVGLIPAVAVVVPLLLAKKLYSKTAYMVLTLGLAASLALTSTIGAITLNNTARAKAESENAEGAYIPVGEEYLSVFSGFMLEGSFGGAAEIVNDYLRIYGYDNTAALMSAELAFCNGDYAGALTLWRDIYGDTLPDEALAADLLVRYGNMQKLGQGTLTDEEIAEAKRLIAGGAIDLINNVLLSRDDVEEYREAAKLVNEAEQLFAKEAYEITEDELSELGKKFDKADNEDVLGAVSPWRNGMLRVNLMNGDHEALIEQLNEFATPEEYSAAVDLYIDGQISDKKIIKTFDLEEPEGSDEVRSQLKKIKGDRESELDSVKLDLLESLIEHIEDYDGNEARYFFEEKLLGFIKDPYRTTDKAKLYYRLAALASMRGDTSAQNEYFSKALTYAADSPDRAFGSAMNEIANLIVGMSKYNKSGMNSEELAKTVSDNRFLLEGSEKYVDTTDNDNVTANELQAYAVKTGSAINIQSVDVSAFPQITAHALVSDEYLTENEIVSLLTLRDCNREITAADIKKASFDKANYILVGDNSGSMERSDIQLLQAAIHAFLDASGEGDSYGFYTFDDALMTEIPLGSAGIDDIREAVDSMYPAGGTAIYNTLKKVLNDTEAAPGASNVIILMTDGYDGDYYGSDITTVSDEIIALAKDKGYMIYLVAVGSDPDEEALSYIANSTGGSAIVSPTSDQLSSLYTFIRSQAENRYEIVYTVADTTADIRPIELTFDGKDVSDLRYYSKNGDTVSGGNGEPTEGYSAGKDVHGLETKLVYKYGAETEIAVTGEGFTEADIMYVTLAGNRAYKLRAEYVNGTEFRITLPENIAIGVYSADIMLNNGFRTFENELTVTDGSTVSVAFGDYTFEAMFMNRSNNVTTLSGNVVMNGWLHFAGDITLRGDIENGSEIYLNDTFGSTVSYADAESAVGYAAYLRENGIAQKIPAFGEIRLQRTASKDTAYAARTRRVLTLENYFELENTVLSLMPEEIIVSFSGANAKLAHKDLLISAVNTSFTPFDFALDGGGSIGRNGISISAERTYSYSVYSSYAVKVFDVVGASRNAPVSVAFNTENASASISYSVKLPDFIIDDFALLSMDWSDMSLDSVKLTREEQYTRRLGKLSVSLEPFTLGFENMASTTKNAPAEKVAALKLSGEMKLSSGPAKDLVPNLGYYMGDTAVIDIASGTYSFAVGSFDVTGTADVTYLGGAVIRNAEIDPNVAEIAIRANNGFDYELNGLKVHLNGPLTVTVNENGADTVGFDGDFSFNPGWWGDTSLVSGKANGFSFGITKIYSNNYSFGLTADDAEKCRFADFGYYITDRGTVSSYQE